MKKWRTRRTMEKTGWRRIPITDIMDRWKKWSSMWKTSVTVWTDCGNSTMQRTTRARFRDLRHRSMTAQNGMISACRRISRWRDTTHRSMPMCSIRGKEEKKSSRARFRSGSIRRLPMWNILKCRSRWKENGFLFPSREQRAVLPYGWTERSLATARIRLLRPSLNWPRIWKRAKINWLRRFSNGRAEAGARIRISSVSPVFTVMCICTRFRRFTFRIWKYRRCWMIRLRRQIWSLIRKWSEQER